MGRRRSAKTRCSSGIVRGRSGRLVAMALDIRTLVDVFGTFEFAKGFLGISGMNEEQQSLFSKEMMTAQKNGQQL